MRSYSTFKVEHAATQAVKATYSSPLLGAQGAPNTGTPGTYGRARGRDRVRERDRVRDRVRERGRVRMRDRIRMSRI